MLSAAEFAKFIGVSREAVRGKHQRGEVLGLRGAKRGLRFPKWQATPNGKLLPDLPRLFKLLGGDSWTVYRFLIQHHPELEGDTALKALVRGKVEKVLAAAKNTGALFVAVGTLDYVAERWYRGDSGCIESPLSVVAWSSLITQ